MPSHADIIRSHFGSYFLAVNPTYEDVFFQQRIVAPALEDLERGEISRLCILMPPGHAKSHLDQAFYAWCLGRHPDRSIFNVSYAYELARTTGVRTKLHLDSTLHHQVFPDCRMTKESRASDIFTLTKGGGFYTAGWDGTINGRRVWGVGIDDPHKSPEEASSPAVVDHLMELYTGVVSQRLPMMGGGWILLTTTRMCRGDFFDRLMDLEGEVKDGGIWYVLRLPACAGDADIFGRPAGAYLFPGPEAAKRYEAEKKKNPEKWNALWQQDPRPISGPWFKEEWLTGKGPEDQEIRAPCFYEGVIAPGKFPAYMICDPATSKDPANDPTSIMVVAGGPERRVFLLDWVLDRIDPGQRTKAILNLVAKWNPVRFIYEEYGLMVDSFILKGEMEKSGQHCYPIPVGRKGPRHGLAKEDRIFELVDDFRDGRIFFPYKMERRLADGTSMDLIRYFIDHEYIPYAGKNSVAHDDGLDTLSRLHEPELAIQYAASYQPRDDDDGRDYRPAGSQVRTWQSVW